MSSNPFRKKGSSGGGDQQQDPSARFPSIDTIDPAPPAATPPPRTSFRANAPPEINLKTAKNGSKVVKKVRVLSPPPLSPDSPEWPFHAPPPQQSQDDGGRDPFESVDEGYASNNAATAPAAAAAAAPVLPGGPPANPFGKTLQDIEPDSDDTKKAQEYHMEREEGAVLKAANAARGSMNVDSFRRLLMTGNAADSSLDSPATSGTSTPDPSATTSKSTSLNEVSVPRRTLEKDTYSESDSSSDSESSTRESKEKKTSRPPPPPSSRHGKSLKGETNDDVSAPNSTSPPPPPRRSLDDELDFAIASSTQETKKPVPAPPPRRGHGRTDTKTNISNSQTTPAAPRKSSEEDLPDSTSPPPDNSRQAPPAPAPPPPRRPHVSNRPMSLQPGLSLPASTGGASNASPTTPQFDSSAQPSPSETPSQNKTSAPPPPPPTRSGTIRRPPSVSSGTDQSSTNPQKQRDGAAAPPPPPPRQRARGSSRSSTEGVPRRTSTDSAVKVEQAANLGMGADILADLDALQREVDALRGKSQ